MLTSIDLLSCVMLIVLLHRRRVSIDRAVWYVWNPLVTIEIAGMGHVDGLGVAAVLMTVVLLHTSAKTSSCLERRRPLRRFSSKSFRVLAFPGLRTAEQETD